MPPQLVRCPDCDEAAKHAYSDATTPGFFYSKCAKHRSEVMADEELKCTYRIRIDDGKDNQGRQKWKHQLCGRPASEVEIGGTLTSAKAVLCRDHKRLADHQNYTSKLGYAFGKVDKEEKANGYLQERLPGTGVREGREVMPSVNTSTTRDKPGAAHPEKHAEEEI